jgi:hypothetical protein
MKRARAEGERRVWDDTIMRGMYPEEKGRKKDKNRKGRNGREREEMQKQKLAISGSKAG